MSDSRSGIKQRDTAIKLPIAEIIEGVEVDDSQGGRAFQTNLGLIRRARILGIVLSRYSSEKEDKKPYTSLTLDDGTGGIRIKAWGADATSLAQYEKGVVLDIIGRVRSYQEEIYLTSELEILVIDPIWELIRRLEIVKHYKDKGVKPAAPSFTSTTTSPTMSVPSYDNETPEIPLSSHEETAPIESEESKPKEEAVNLETLKNKLIVLIKNLDTGKGAVYDDLKEQMGSESEELFEEALMDLLHEGVAYEPSSSRYKVLK